MTFTEKKNPYVSIKCQAVHVMSKMCAKVHNIFCIKQQISKYTILVSFFSKQTSIGIVHAWGIKKYTQINFTKFSNTFYTFAKLCWGLKGQYRVKIIGNSRSNVSRHSINLVTLKILNFPLSCKGGGAHLNELMVWYGMEWYLESQRVTHF